MDVGNSQPYKQISKRYTRQKLKSGLPKGKKIGAICKSSQTMEGEGKVK